MNTRISANYYMEFVFFSNIYSLLLLSLLIFRVAKKMLRNFSAVF